MPNAHLTATPNTTHTINPLDLPWPAALAPLGWNADVHANLQRALAEGDAPDLLAHLCASDDLTDALCARLARVSTVFGPEVAVWTAAGDRRVHLPFALRDHTVAPTVGDWVWLGRDARDRQDQVAGVVPAARALVRRAAGRRDRPQRLASNIDRVFIVTSLNQEYKASRIERYLTLVHAAQAEPVLVLNKADLVADTTRWRARAESLSARCPVVILSALKGDGIDALTPYLRPGQTIALVGSSGVGKSTLVNALCAAQLQDTGAIRADDDEGRHTTTRRDMLRLPHGRGLLIDTPGLREIQFWHDDLQSVEQTFADLEDLAARCRFRDCAHDNEPGCAVRDAIALGVLSEARIESWRELRREVARRAERAQRAGRRKRRGARMTRR